MQDHEPDIRHYLPEDLSSIHEIITASAEADRVDPESTLESVPTIEELEEAFDAMGEKRNTDLLVTTDPETDQVTGYGLIRWWEEDDGTYVYLHDGAVHPNFRRLGTGKALLNGLQKRINEVAASHPSEVPKVYATNATDTEQGLNELLLTDGYEDVHTAVEMKLPEGVVFDRLTPPEGYELRPVVSESDKRAVYDANKKVYKGVFGSSLPSEDDYQELLEDAPDASLWKVLWHGNEIAGFVLSRQKDDAAEMMEVSVMPNFRRQHLGQYLMIESILELQDRGADKIRLHTDANGASGGRQLYESLGFEALKEHRRYRKAIGGN